MKFGKKIDETLKERHGILHLLERLKKDSITLDEMEEIGEKLRKSGGRALSPLVRRLWRERSSDIISRYAYLLDYFDEEVWMGELVQIALRRRDLDEEGKAVLLAALKGYGVDINTPPFARLLAEAGSSLELMFIRLLDMGDEGYVVFIEDFLCHSPDVQLAMIQQLGSLSDPRVLGLLEILLWLDDEEIVAETVRVLGRVRSPVAARLLKKYGEQAEGARKEMVVRSLRRLSFLGIESEEPDSCTGSHPFHAASASPVDASGCRSLWISRWESAGRVSALYLQMHEVEGLKGAWGCSDLAKEVDEQFREITDEEGLVTIPVEYALLLVRDAVARTTEAGLTLPADFHVQRPRLFEGQNISPRLYDAEEPVLRVTAAARPARTKGEVSSLFEDDFFAGWFIASGRVYDYAEEWEAAGRSGKPGGEEALLERFCREILAPDLQGIRRRLLINADLMRLTGKDDAVIEVIRSAADSLLRPPLLCHRNPFLRRFALESINMAREALAEGFDLRLQPPDDDEA